MMPEKWYNIVSIMRNIVFLPVLFACAAVFAHGLDDVCVSFSTQGPDRYADGTEVLDGECYALVWSTDGVFDGFTADGGCVDAADRTVLVAPVAKGGRCPPVLFQIPSAVAAELSDGVYSLYLLDTRVVSDGKTGVAGTKSGRPALMNGYGSVTSAIGVGGDKGAAAAAVRSDGAPARGYVAGKVAAVPGNCVQPKVKSVRVDGENVYLTVENLKGYMRVQGGKDVKAAGFTGAATATAGTGGEVVLVAPKAGEKGFYRVVRNEVLLE